MTEIFNLLIVYLINTLLFVRIKQTSENRRPEAAIEMCLKIGVPREKTS